MDGWTDGRGFISRHEWPQWEVCGCGSLAHVGCVCVRVWLHLWYLTATSTCEQGEGMPGGWEEQVLVSQTCVKRAPHTARHCPTCTPAHLHAQPRPLDTHGAGVARLRLPRLQPNSRPSFFKSSSVNVLPFLGLLPPPSGGVMPPRFP